jgi:hypothetical protein
MGVSRFQKRESGDDENKNDKKIIAKKWQNNAVIEIENPGELKFQHQIILNWVLILPP